MTQSPLTATAIRWRLNQEIKKNSSPPTAESRIDRLSAFVIFGRLFVKRFALCYRSVVCLSCLSVTLVYCGQTVGRIKMKLGMQLGPGDFVLDGDPALPPPLNFRPMFTIVIVISLKHCTMHSLLVCSSSSFSILCILLLESLIVLSLSRYAQLHHIVPSGR